MDQPCEDDAARKNDSTAEEQETVKSDKNEPKPNSSLTKFFSGTSRYGRTIKPKSPSTVLLEFSKNIKMPKTIEDAASEDESNKVEDSSSIMDDSVNITLDDSMKMDEEKLDNEDIQSKSPWTLGQIVWARMASFPFWPSVVTLDPQTMLYVTLKASSGRSNKVPSLHVRFCADKGRHSWVSFANIIPFQGLADFEKRRETVTPELKKKEPKYAAAFTIKPSMKYKWDDAVAEASGLMIKSVETRIELFNPNKKKNSLHSWLNSSGKKSSLDKSSNSEKSEENNKKRKQMVEDEELPSKKSKLDTEEVEEIDEKAENKTIDGNNINLETPPTPPLSNKDSSDEAPISRKLRKKKNLGKDGVFEVFCERNKEVAEELDPEATEDDIKAYLLDVWENMSSQERSKYRGDYLQGDGIRLYSLNLDEDEEEDADSEPDPEKSPRRRRTKAELSNEELSDQEEINEKSLRRRKSKVDYRMEDEISEQEENEEDESENIEKSRKRKTKTRCESSDREDIAFNELEANDKFGKKRKSKMEKEELSNGEYISSLLGDAKKRPYKLFKGMKNERVCQICERTGKLVRCKGPCYSYYHPSCVKPDDSSSETSETEDLDENSAYKEDLKEIKEKVKECREEEHFDDENFKCIDCLSGVAPPCFVCHEREGNRVKCSVIACGKHYHTACLQGAWPQSHWQGGRLTCPYHVCHTCVSDNPQDNHPRSVNDKFARCVRCPSTYHAAISCLPAGSNILTGSQIICPKHYKSAHPPVNATWCFLCTEGGSLICCDTCPMSFHLECLGIEAPDGGFICEDCETGRLPLYGEVVWVKLGTCRWWPSVICFPQEIPPNIATRPHKTGEFCVMFLGTKDYYWIHRGKAFLFQDGDASVKVMGSKKVEESYRRALEEAIVFHERITFEKAEAKDKEVSRYLKPPPYVKLKVNKPVGNVKIREADSIVACYCDPNQPNPCSPDSDCLNRILLVECSPDYCPAGTQCENQMFVQRKYPSMKPVHTEERGWGLRALEHIKQGQFVIEYVGEIIDEAEYRLRLAQKKERKNENYYFLTIDNSRMIDAEPKGNLSRFMNHSCQPNCETQKWTVNGDTRIGLFALRNIEPGEELTFNYNLACDGETRKPCLCKAPNCSGFIGLKVPKQSLSLAQQKKIEKDDKVVAKKRKYKKSLTCWNCNFKIDNPNESYRCDQKTCGKVYHPHCIAIEDGPDQIFHCPWHFCAECYKRTSLRCVFCCNAFCQLHALGNLHEQPKTGVLVCFNHLYNLKDMNDVDIGEALMDDDGDDDVDEVFNTMGSENNQVPKPVKASTPPPSSSPPSISRSDEDSARGAIVEVRMSSEEDDEEDSEQQQDQELDMGDTEDPNGNSSRRRRRRRKHSAAESDFTLDQIAAIIGIVK